MVDFAFEWVGSRAMWGGFGESVAEVWRGLKGCHVDSAGRF